MLSPLSGLSALMSAPYSSSSISATSEFPRHTAHSSGGCSVMFWVPLKQRRAAPPEQPPE